MKALPAAARVLEDALRERVASAIVAECGDSAGPRWSWAGGTLARHDPAPVTTATIFDLASLTKVIATTSCALLRVREGALVIDTPVASIVPHWTGADRQTVTVRDLLEHSSGLPAHRAYYRDSTGTESFVRAIATEPLDYPVRTRAVYSDLGFIVLGHVLERVAGLSLDRQFADWRAQAAIVDPLSYTPPPEWRGRTAVTEFDAWRERWLQGEVHDQNAAALGGVAAHAGLFGTVAAVGAAARWWLRELMHRDDARQFTMPSRVPGSSRALGWDTMLPTSSCGERMPADAVGHTGFTGTSLWLAPSVDRYFVLLTNRVHTDTSLERISALRRSFHDAVNTSLP